MGRIAQKELRNHVGEVLRRAEAGEEIEITVAGRPVATLGPAKPRRWVSGDALQAVFATPAPLEPLEPLAGAIADPFECESSSTPPS